MRYEDLAIAEEESKLEQAIGEHRNLLVEAPTGSGKSLYIPWFLSKHCKGRVVVLQPRRIAAISLAQYSAKLHEESCGRTVGYQVRQDSCKSSETKILFQTYGNFLQELLHGKLDADWIVFDEYHERKADMDLLFSYLLKKGPRIAVMSAKLNRDEMESALGVKCLELGHPLYPVQILHQNPTTGNTLEAEVVKALRTLKLNDVWKTTLVFLPGKGEIMRCHTAAEEALGSQAAEYLDLFGGQERNIQDRIFEETERPRVIFTTNIAETSITVPNVSGVVDSGIERVSEYDDSEKVNVLRTSAISMQNAIQRSGRSGRTQNGCAIRLWSEEAEKRMPQGIIPEMTQIEPSELLLQKASLEKSVGTLTLPTDIPENRKQTALKLLEGFGMLDAGAITELGEKAIRTPVTDIPLALILATAKSADDLSDLTLAAMAWIHSGTEFVQKSKQPLNLISLAGDSLKGGSAPREVTYTLRQLQDYRKNVFGNSNATRKDDEQQLIRTLLHSYPDRQATPAASQNGGVYKLDNGNVIRLQVAEPPYAILSLSMLRTGGGSKSELRVNLYVPVPKELLVHSDEPIRYELLWRSGQERFIGKEIQGASEREILPQEASPAVLTKLKELTVDAWKEKLEKENWDGKFLTENVQTLLIKMRLAAKLYPEFGLPEFNEEDMELIFNEFTDGIFLLRDINEDRYRAIIEDYFGKSMLQWLGKTFPDHFVLPNGKRARYSYQQVFDTGDGLTVQSAEGVLVEISARIEDLMVLRGEHHIADGKLKVRYDILAPNFRTIQKTWDLTGFWQNTYAEVRKELRGRYPKHPWPESVI
ncbi:ATP-dependent helicase C-terminal domain-containing protein [Fibrobacter sp. UWEL]|uniref:ATP-dependent helicase C-terminal domain-containing protein n=1 Tax=Fibrobacter sp. UWEL TaxID=1896209 RepID=UPI00090F19C6|nr:ATP-dependent helicase C-terminal domain-containing protein [Fibrobacter sp. UWEL]SHK31350.1 HrpA-like RNA helicase [Fibrobacter sp. UWEL]